MVINMRKYYEIMDAADRYAENKKRDLLIKEQELKIKKLALIERWQTSKDYPFCNTNTRFDMDTVDKQWNDLQNQQKQLKDKDSIYCRLFKTIDGCEKFDFDCTKSIGNEFRVPIKRHCSILMNQVPIEPSYHFRSYLLGEIIYRETDTAVYLIHVYLD